jgi:molecular chaperone DnaJ
MATIPSLDGKVKLKIPAGTQSEKILRLAGKGLAQLNGGARGDQLVRIHVRTPERIGREERELFERLAQIESKPKGGVFGRARDLFS